MKTYTATATFNGQQYTDTKTETIPATSAGTYTYSETPEWVWSDDLSSATATFTANEDASVTQSVEATITSEVTQPATETEPGVKTYTATATFNGQQYTDTKTGAIPATGAGTYTYSETPEWVWSDDLSSATATFTANEDASVTQSVEATITSEVTQPATETEPGVKTYTATATFNGQQYTDTKTGAIPATGAGTYTYSTTPEWTWDSNYKSATAKFVSNEDPAIFEVVNATITSEIVSAPSYNKKGERKYTATVIFNDQTYTDTKTEEISATPVIITSTTPTIITSDDGNNNGSGTTTTTTGNTDSGNAFKNGNNGSNSNNTGYNYNNNNYNDRIVISSNVPTYVADRTYTGTMQYADTSAIDTNKMLLSGTLSAVNPGTYTYTVTPINGYAWSDGTTGSKTVTWRIVNNTTYSNSYNNSYGYNYNPYYNTYTANRNSIVSNGNMVSAGVQISSYVAYVGEPVQVSNTGKYVAVVYNSVTGNPIAVIPPNTTSYFTMPDANAVVRLADDIRQTTSTTTTAAASEICIYDANMKLYKTASTTKDVVTIKFGKDNANKTVRLYSGKNKSGKLLFETKTDSEGTLSFTINHGREYSVVLG